MNEPSRIPVETADGQRLALTHWAHPAPTGAVLLIHGFGQNVMTWHSGLRSLPKHLQSQGWEVFGVDLRGHGASRKTSRCAASLGDYLNADLPAVFNLVTESHKDGPLVVLGHSLGGLMGGALALQYPGAVAAVGMVSSPGRMRLGTQFALARMLPAARRFVPGFRMLERIPFRLDLIGMATAMTVQLAGEGMARFPISPWLAGSMEKELLVERLSRGFDVTGWGVVTELADWGETGRLAVPGVSDDLLADLAALTQPVLLVDADRDEIVPPRLAMTESAFPAAPVTRHRLNGFGHCDILLGRTAPELVWPHIDEFLGTLA